VPRDVPRSISSRTSTVRRFLEEGRVLSLEVYAYDPVGDRVIDTTLFATGPAERRVASLRSAKPLRSVRSPN
jgi:hypothetical protein